MYDLVFVTNMPAFYKINLYNEIAKDKKIYVLFIGNSSDIRTKDFYDFDMNFEHSFLFEKEFEKVSFFRSFFKTLNFLKIIKYNKIILGGWDHIVLWMFAFLSSRSRNYTVIESSIYESKTTGIYLFLKKIFKFRMKGVFVSGKAQTMLAERIGYKYIIKTGGVGLFNKVNYIKNDRKEFNKKFLYIGRLSEEKNLNLLIEAFQDLSDCKLEIVGNGPLKDYLLEKVKGSKNINYFPHIENDKINQKYLENDIFILPSIKEPWGLVIEEALYYGLPVIVSNNVGCKDDMVIKYQSGKVFDNSSKEDLIKCIEFFLDKNNYDLYRSNVIKINFDKLFLKQIESYSL